MGEGGTKKEGHFLEKGAPPKGNLKTDIYNFLDTSINPYILISLSGVISIFLSLYTPYKILLKHHALQLGVMVRTFICKRIIGVVNKRGRGTSNKGKGALVKVKEAPLRFE